MNVILALTKSANYYTDPGEPVLYINGTGSTTQVEISSSCVISEIQRIVFNGDITVIGVNSFRDFVNLENILFTETIKTIDDYAFYGCSKLTEMALPNSVEHIKSGAFSNCKCLTKIVFSKNLIEVSTEYLIEFSTNVREFEIKENKNFWVSKSKDILIQNLTLKLAVFDVRKIEVPKEVEIIGSNFMMDHNIEEILFEEGSRLHTINSKAFEQSSLKRIVLPHGLKKIVSDPFIKCYDLEYVYLPSTIEEFESIFTVLPKVVDLNGSCVALRKAQDGAIYDSTGKELVYFPPTLNSFTINERVEKFNGKVLTTATDLREFNVDPNNKIFLHIIIYYRVVGNRCRRGK